MTTLAAEAENGVLVVPPPIARMTSHIGGDNNPMPWVTEKDEAPMSLPPIVEAAEEAKPDEAPAEEKPAEEAKPDELPPPSRTGVTGGAPPLMLQKSFAGPAPEEKKPDEAPAEEKTEEKTPDEPSMKTDASGNLVDPSDDGPKVVTEILNKVVDEAVASGEKIVAEVAEAAQKVVDEEKTGFKRVNSDLAHEAAKCAKVEEPATPRPVSSMA